MALQRLIEKYILTIDIKLSSKNNVLKTT